MSAISSIFPHNGADVLRPGVWVGLDIGADGSGALGNLVAGVVHPVHGFSPLQAGPSGGVGRSTSPAWMAMAFSTLIPQ